MSDLEITPKMTGKKNNKFIIGGIILAAAVVLLVFTSIKGSAQYYYTVQELISGKALHTNLRVSGAVIGDSIQYDLKTQELSFLIANIPGDNRDIEAAGGLAKVLHEASIDPDAARIMVVYIGEKPDMLKNEAQVIATGSLADNGRFVADELLLKCPSKYEDSAPSQVSP